MKRRTVLRTMKIKQKENFAVLKQVHDGEIHKAAVDEELGGLSDFADELVNLNFLVQLDGAGMVQR
jgi:hypothetical protein